MDLWIMQFLNFIKNVQKSDKIGVQLMLRKVIHIVDTVTCQNVRFIQDTKGKYPDLLSQFSFSDNDSCISS